MSDRKLAVDVDEYLDEDNRTITFDEPPDCKSPMSPLLHGMGLDLSFAAAERKPESDSGCKGVQEESVLVVFEFPDGSQSESQFRLGQTVEYLKSYIESEFGIPMQEQSLIYEGRPMIDPLSLLDFPGAKGSEEIYVRVEGNLPAEAKK